jgi:hypothetical protein
VFGRRSPRATRVRTWRSCRVRAPPWPTPVPASSLVIGRFRAAPDAPSLVILTVLLALLACAKHGRRAPPLPAVMLHATDEPPHPSLAPVEPYRGCSMAERCPAIPCVGRSTLQRRSRRPPPLQAEQSSLPPSLLPLYAPSLLTDTSLGLMRAWAGHTTTAQSPSWTSALSPRRGRRREPGSRGQKATDVHRPRCGWPRKRLSAVQLSSRSTAVESSAAGRRNPPRRSFPLLCSVLPEEEEGPCASLCISPRA